MRTFLIIVLFTLSLSLHAQQPPAGDDHLSKDWPTACKKVEIPSTLDDHQQPAMFFRADSDSPRPLVVSLHTWSGGYEQKDSLSWQCIEQGYHYIHPHFRGPNRSPQACGSPFAIQDIEDAITYALQNANVDTNEIHVIGSSGGGYATLFTYMNTRHPVKTFSAWVPISDIEKWYYESKGRGNKYALDIAQATVGRSDFNRDFHFLNKKEAISRSPIYMDTPTGLRRNSKLFIYAGVHDGYTGSVPITHSLNFYNKVVQDWAPGNTKDLIPEEDILELVVSRSYRENIKEAIAGRTIHYRKTFQDKVQLTIFEGTHESLLEVALDPVKGKNVLLIGDSNGAAPEGWADQLRYSRMQDRFFNTSISGNTIGFTNNGNPKLNTLLQVDAYVQQAKNKLGKIDIVVIMLGTNDCKAVFQDRLEEVPNHLQQLIRQIKHHRDLAETPPEIIVVSPPPIGKDEIMLDKYHGAAKRVAWLQPKFKAVTEAAGGTFIDVYHKLLGLWDDLAPDGIHPNETAHQIIAQTIAQAIN